MKAFYFYTDGKTCERIIDLAPSGSQDKAQVLIESMRRAGYSLAFSLWLK